MSCTVGGSWPTEWRQTVLKSIPIYKKFAQVVIASVEHFTVVKDDSRETEGGRGRGDLCVKW